MKLNFKLRLKNPTFVYTLIAYVLSYVFAYYGMTGAELTSWTSVYELIVDVFKNPTVILPLLVGVFGQFVDFTTKGITDSNRVMDYDTPDGDI